MTSLSAINTTSVIDGYNSYDSPIYLCRSLRDFGGFIGWKNNLYLTGNKALTYESVKNVINGLADGVTNKTLYLAKEQFDMLSEEDIAIATSKGWYVSA